MLSFNFYKLVHLTGVILLFLALGGLALHALAGGARASNPARKLVYGTHGVGAVLALTGGFGMLARLGMVQAHQFPGWALAKMGIWLLLAVAVVLPYRSQRWPRALWVALAALGVLAAYLGRYKPF